jgi:hypothetical protein
MKTLQVVKPDKHEGRTILMLDGEPALVRMAMRKATSAPSRIKAALVLPVSDEDGEESYAPLPFSQAVVGAGPFPPNGWTPEWRLEMN